jgi:hypothetical protein
MWHWTPCFVACGIAGCQQQMGLLTLLSTKLTCVQIILACFLFRLACCSIGLMVTLFDDCYFLFAFFSHLFVVFSLSITHL